MTILLKSIWPIASQSDYKVHFARWNGEYQPLEVWARDRGEWREWQEYWPGRDDFNRPRIFSLMQFYHEPDTWLFGGVFDVVRRLADAYEVRPSSEGAGFEGRLKIGYTYRQRPTRVNLENHYDHFVVAEVLPRPFSGRAFPGYDDIAISFEELETIVRNERMDWRAALENIKGIYLITDAQTAQRYVGSAYGEAGIWGRWCSYVATGHGGNVELRSLVTDPTLDYCRRHFRFALLEHRPKSASDELILQREDYWKRILLTRGELNRN